MWIDKIPLVLWSICTTLSHMTGSTTFQLVYSAEAILPVEVALGSTRAHMVNQDLLGLELERHLDLDIVEGIRCRALL